MRAMLLAEREGRPVRLPNFVQAAAFCLLLASSFAFSEEPKPTPGNTISVKLTNEVKPQTFSRPIKFYVENVIDRSANPQPMLVYKPRGGVFLDRQPTEVVRQALEEALKKSNILADDRASANYLLSVYLFHFGLDSGTGTEYFAKVELNVVVKDVGTGKSETVTAVGTSIQGIAFRKKTILKNVEANIDEALETSLRNFLRGTKLRDAVALPEAAPAAAPSEPEKSSPQGSIHLSPIPTLSTKFVEV
jgi:hypothetical protein